jgi:predicted PurR-regulated permease PerM
LKDYLVSLSPLTDKDNALIVSRLKSAISATVRSTLVIGLAQGALTGVGFRIFGVPNPILWGSIATLTALVPGVGTALVITPAIIFLFFTGSIFGGIGLLVWGVVVNGFVDNFWRPKLIGDDTQLHPLVVLLAVLGGLALFGPLGFVLGPLAVNICLALAAIYASLGPKRGR